MEVESIRFAPKATHQFRYNPGALKFKVPGRVRYHGPEGTWGQIRTVLKTDEKQFHAKSYTVQKGTPTFQFKIPRPGVTGKEAERIPTGGSVLRVVGTENSEASIPTVNSALPSYTTSNPAPLNSMGQSSVVSGINPDGQATDRLSIPGVEATVQSLPTVEEKPAPGQVQAITTSQPAPFIDQAERSPAALSPMEGQDSAMPMDVDQVFMRALEQAFTNEIAIQTTPQHLVQVTVNHEHMEVYEEPEADLMKLFLHVLGIQTRFDEHTFLQSLVYAAYKNTAALKEVLYKMFHDKNQAFNQFARWTILLLYQYDRRHPDQPPANLLPHETQRVLKSLPRWDESLMGIMNLLQGMAEQPKYLPSSSATAPITTPLLMDNVTDTQQVQSALVKYDRDMKQVEVAKKLKDALDTRKNQVEPRKRRVSHAADSKQVMTYDRKKKQHVTRQVDVNRKRLKQ